VTTKPEQLFDRVVEWKAGRPLTDGPRSFDDTRPGAVPDTGVQAVAASVG
jgi:hypothetical protein